MDAFEYSERCRVAHLAESDDIFRWMSKVLQFPSLAPYTVGATCVKFCSALEKLNLTWLGRPLTSGKSFWICAPYVMDPRLKQAWQEVVALIPQLNGITLIYGMIQKAESWSGEKGDDVVDHLVWAFQSLINLVVFREICPKDATYICLLGCQGKRKDTYQIGLLQTLWYKKALLAHIQASHEENLRKAGLLLAAQDSEVLVKLGSPSAFRRYFTPFGYKKDIKDDWDYEERHEGARGITFHCKEVFHKWLRELRDPMDQALAVLLFHLHGRSFDKELRDLASGYANQSHGEAQKARDKALMTADRSSETDTALQEAFRLYVNACMRKPTRAVKTGTMDESRAHGGGSTVPNMDPELQELAQEKLEVTRLLEKWRYDQVAFVAEEFEIDTRWGSPGHLTKLLHQTRFHKDRELTNTKRLWLIPMELLPPMIDAFAYAMKGKDYMCKHTVLTSLEAPERVRRTLDWVFSSRMTDKDWVVLFDGRFRQARVMWDGAARQAALDQTLVEDMVVLYQDYADGDFRSPPRTLGYMSCKKENIYLSLPGVKRSDLPAMPRSNYNISGEASSHDLSYSGVEMRSLDEIPMLTPEEPRQRNGVWHFQLVVTVTCSLNLVKLFCDFRCPVCPCPIPTILPHAMDSISGPRLSTNQIDRLWGHNKTQHSI